MEDPGTPSRSSVPGPGEDALVDPAPPGSGATGRADRSADDPQADPDRFLNREITWLSFNERVLQEAEDSRVPVLDRLSFLAIFSSNLDEFFRVRVASLRSLLRLKKKKRKKLSLRPRRLLREIHRTVTDQQDRFGNILRNRVLPEMEASGILTLFLVPLRFRNPGTYLKRAV
jgi:polyphosphate kinase